MQPRLVGRERELQLVRDRLEADACITLAGPAGVGKTRLAHEAALAMRGRDVEVVAGSHVARQVPFGATASLVPRVQAKDPHHLIQLAVERAQARCRTGRLVLVVDDAHLLDPSSSVLVRQLITLDGLSCVLTVRTPEPVPDAIASLWESGLGDRHDVGPLDPAAAGRLLVDVLANDESPWDVGVALGAEVWRLTRGHPLFLRELALSALATGSIVLDDEGVWRSRGPLVGGQRLLETIEARLPPPTDPLREATELLALGEPLRREIAVAALGEGVLEELEARRLVDGRDDGAFRLVHPLHGEVVRAAMPAVRRGRLASRLVEALDGIERVAGEALRFAILLETAGRPVPADVAFEAASDALVQFDAQLAERLARTAVQAHPVAAGLLLGAALRQQQRGDDAEGELERAAAAATEDDDVARVALERARNHMWTRASLEAAHQVLVGALGEVGDSAWAGALEVELGMYAGTVGDFATASRRAEQALARPDLSPHVELAARVVLSLVQGFRFQLAALDAHIGRALELATRLRVEAPFAIEQLRINRIMSSMYADLDEATRTATEGLRPNSPMLGISQAMTGLVALLRGDVRSARRHVGDAVVHLAVSDPFANLPMVRAVRAVVAGHAGDRAALERFLAEGTSAPGDVRARVWSDRARVWEVALAGDLDGAARAAADAGRRAVDDEHLVWGADLLHDAIRFGGTSTADVLADVVGGCGLPIAELFADHARAAADRDPDVLLSVAREFFHAGAPLFGAEAAGRSARLLDERGDALGASRAATFAAALLDHCEDARTPTITGVSRLGLSRRERQVARAAAAGRSNREIADWLVLSERTVENHLFRVYRKLALDGRAELTIHVP